MFIFPAGSQWEVLHVEGAQLNAGFIILSIFLNSHILFSPAIIESEYN